MMKKVRNKWVLIGVIVCMSLSSITFGMTKSPFAKRETGGLKLYVTAWFNSGYKTTAKEKVYNVKPGKYIKQCWVRIKEGDYDETRKSKCYKIKEAKQGHETLEKTNNPFCKATLTWGWAYN